MNKHTITTALVLFGMMLAPISAASTQRIVYGQVTDVQPVTETYEIKPTGTCNLQKPLSPASLADLLAWDLQSACAHRRDSRVVAYRVEYRWDGRTYSRTMAKHPGKRVPLLLKLR